MKESTDSVAIKQRELLDGLVNDTNGVVNALGAETKKAVAELNSEIQSHGQFLADSLDACVLRANTFNEAYNVEIAKASESAASASEELIHGLKSSLEPLRQHTTEWKEEVRILLLLVP